MCKCKKNDDDCCDNYYDESNLGCSKCSDSCQTVVIEHGPVILQTVIVDKELYSKFGCGYFETPLQKVVLQDEGCCYYPKSSSQYCYPYNTPYPTCNTPYPTCNTPCSCQDECEPQQNVKVVVKDPNCYKAYYPGYYQ